MEDIENIELQQKEKNELLYSKEDFEAYKARLSEEFLEKEEKMKQELEIEAKKATMSELELTRLELDEMKQKYQEKENECLIAKQKEEVVSILDEAGLDRGAIELIYIPLDMEATKLRIEILKNYTEKVKKDFLESIEGTDIPLTSGNFEYDAFIEGFDNNEL